MLQRQIVKDMKCYPCNQSENLIYMNANESAFNLTFQIEKINLNRYPDNDSNLLKRRVADYNQVDTDQIILGNGSSEIIEIIMKTYLNPGECVMSYEPTFSMYKQFAEIYNGTYLGLKTKDYVLDVDLMIEYVKKENPKILFICNPNNPTGQMMKKYDIERILNVSKGIVVVDEAYMDFSEGSMINRIGRYSNLIVLRTFSKAWGLAGARVGYGIAGSRRIAELMKVKSPYNLNELSQKIAYQAFDNLEMVQSNIKRMINMRDQLLADMNKLDIKSYKSYANFIFFTCDLPLEELLKDSGIVIRGFNNGTYRVTVSTEENNQLFLKSLRNILEERMVVCESKCAN